MPVTFSGGAIVALTPDTGFITEDAAAFYVAEDGTTYYIQE